METVLFAAWLSNSSAFYDEKRCRVIVLFTGGFEYVSRVLINKGETFLLAIFLIQPGFLSENCNGGKNYTAFFMGAV